VKKLSIAQLIVFLITVCAWTNDTFASQLSTQQKAQVEQMTLLGVPTEAAVKIQNHFQEQNMVRAHNIIRATKEQNIPLNPVIDKALEGIAKNVPDENIVRAMEQVRNRYATAMHEAQQMTQSKSRQQTMTRSMFHAMSAGIPPEDVSDIAKQVRSRQRTMSRTEYEDMAEETCLTLRDMARMGTSPKEVKETLSAALQRQYSANQMNQMRNRFMHQAQHTSPDAVAGQFQAHVRAGNDFGQNGPGRGSGSRGGGSTGNGSGGGNSGGGGGNGGNGGGKN
jgi:uncharacterized membrane protein YgcG